MARALRIASLVWGVTFLAEAAARVLIVETTSAGNALLVVKLMPYLVLGVLLRWMMSYLRGVTSLHPAVSAADLVTRPRGAASPPARADPRRQPRPFQLRQTGRRTASARR